ncbi:MAG: MerR family transcriptional regulator [Nitrospirae bacterium]|nr:MerR family transcriptional regulator [Nitrospirota bacterium]
MYRSVSELPKPGKPLPDKLFYKIGEVSKIVGVEPYVLRYWEMEFPFLRPRKNKSGQRVYVKKDLEILLQIKSLLYKERYTIEGVRKRLSAIHMRSLYSDNEGKISDPNRDPLKVIKHVKRRLREILNHLE